MDRENFIKGQLEAVHKALNKQEVPLKPKHARRLILGTHQEKSSNVFWNAVNRIQLEKNPVLTWKFCHLLHKLIRDGHRKVPEESHRYISRLKHLAQFWHHLHSGYGVCNDLYCKLLIDRLEFHRKFPVVPGNLNLTDAQLKSIQSDLDSAYESTIEMLDQMDNLLTLQEKVFETIEYLGWSSLVPQGQTLLAPLIIAILDTSKFYDFLVKILFHLHSSLPPDTLAGHRDRFKGVFHKTKKFYEMSAALQYFKYLVSVPTLPASPPNFLQAAELDSYQTPHAHLYGDGDSEDGRSVMGDNALVDLDESRQPQHSPASIPDPRDDQIVHLTRIVEDERFAKERLIAEARSRIEQYENRLAQMQNEIEHVRREADDHRTEAERARAELSTRHLSLAEQEDARVREANERLRASEEKFAKLKAVYDRFRTEHLTALQKLGDLQKKLEEFEREQMDKTDEMRNYQRRLEESEKLKSDWESKAQRTAGLEDEMRTQLAMADAQAEELRKSLESEKVRVFQLREGCVTAALAMLSRCEIELPNATSITYPPHLALSNLTWAQEIVGKAAAHDSPDGLALAGHAISTSLVNCAAAAYTASIQHYDDVNESCKEVLVLAPSALRSSDFSALSASLSRLHSLITALPVQSDVDKEVVGHELDEEMRRMDLAIKAAVDKIVEIQRKARENTNGLRLEVNEKILECCQALMAAIAVLVARSRELQIEIVAAGRGHGPPEEFYKRNHQWTEGLLSAAKAVGVAARYLVSSADGVVSGAGKFEELIVAAQEIAASTAQLFVSSRVKADPGSEKMSALSVASRAVNQATAQVVASVKSGQTTLNEKDALDFSHLSLHDAKKEEMESQVRTLELEQALVRERAKLAELRKQHYHMASLVANKDNNSDNSFEMVG